MNDQNLKDQTNNDPPETTTDESDDKRAKLDFKQKSTWFILIIISGAVTAMFTPLFTSDTLPDPGRSVVNLNTTDTDENARVLVPNIDITVQTKQDAENEAARFENDSNNRPAFGENVPPPADDDPEKNEKTEESSGPFGYMDEIVTRNAEENNRNTPPFGSAEIKSEEEQRWQEELNTRKIAPAIMTTYAGEYKEQEDPAEKGKSSKTEDIDEIENNTTTATPWGRERHGGTQALNLQNPAQEKATFTPAIYEPDIQYRLLQGTTIPLTLETSINSNLPGTVRALVNQPVYASSGENLVIPPRSRIIGEYATARTGDRRLFIIWQRLITPQGIEIFLNSPSSGPLGDAGAKGKLNRRFFERFGAAMIFSLIAEFTSQNNSGTSFTIQNAPRTAAHIALEDSIGLAPIIEIKPGSQLTAQTARDLDFREALTAFRQHRNPNPIIPFIDVAHSLMPSETEILLNELGLPHDAGQVLLAANELTELENVPPRDTSETIEQTITPVYLIPKKLLVVETPKETVPETPPLPTACQFIHLKRSEYLSWQIDKWVEGCLNKSMEWAVGEYQVWKDFIIEQDRYVPLPAGVTSLKEMLAERWRILLTETETKVIIHEGGPRHD